MSRLAARILSLFSAARCSRLSAPSPARARSGARPVRGLGSTPATTPPQTRLYPAGQVILREGAPGDSLFVVLSGRVAVRREPDGRSGWELGQLAAGSFFGELAPYTRGPRTATVVAVDRTAVLELSPTGVREAGARYGVGDTVVRTTCRERLLADACRGSPLLAALPEELRVLVGGLFAPQAAQAGECLLTRGRPGDAIYLLLRGRCAVLHPHADGRTSALRELEEGALFGEISLLRSKRATATVRTLTPCTLLRVDRDRFQTLSLGQTALGDSLVKLGLQRLRRTLRAMAEAPRVPARASRGFRRSA